MEEIEIDSQIKLNKNFKILIKDISINFPCKPYQIQINYMEKVIELLNNKLNKENYNGFTALESPTGTGKTLSVICSVLGWVNEMKKQKKFDGKIMYVTRTHSQISQIINELKKTNYKPKTAILSSREFSCINDGLKQKENININMLNIICRNIKKKCIYKNEFEGNFLCDLSEDNIVDIEDLCKYGKQKNICPFYHQINKAQNFADIIFMPYNYLFYEEIRNNLCLNLNNNIIIIDEAHNINKVCEDIKSFEICNTNFLEIISELNNIKKMKETPEKNNKVDNQLLQEYLEKISLQEIVNEIKIVGFIQDKLQEIKINNNDKLISYKELI